MTGSSTDREALLARIKAISARTEDNGCTEAEGAVVRAQFAELGLKLRSHGGGRSTGVNGGAYAAGEAAGERVSFNHGIGQSGGTALLGRR